MQNERKCNPIKGESKWLGFKDTEICQYNLAMMLSAL